MELTPQQLCDVEFSEQWRGYNRDQVDDFIERVAAAVSTLQDRLRKMTERAVRAEQRSQEGNEADGAARRTLVLAQRTADATVAEAKDTAARLIAQAQEEARAIMLAAETVSETMPAAEPSARAEIADLEVTRSRLQADVAALESHVTDRRARIKGLLDELQRRVDEGLEGRIAQWPSLDERILTDEPDETVDLAEYYDDDTGLISIDDAPVATSPEEDPATSDETSDNEPDEEGEPGEPDDELIFDLTPPEWEPDDSPSAVIPAPSVEPSVDTGGDMADTGGASRAYDELAVPAPVPSMAEASAQDVDDDTFFAHLRGALHDDAPLGPREDADGVLQWRDEATTAVAQASSLYDQGQPERRKFGRKKRRQP
jgi:cell division initiation protein